MALSMKQQVLLDNVVETIFQIDKTGEYSSPDNEGGYGTPNPELNQSALLALCFYKSSNGEVECEAIGGNLKYNPAAANTDETEFKFQYVNDGWYDHYLFWLAVSNDGSTDLTGRTLDEEEYFYYQGALYQIQTATPVLIEDATVVRDQETIVKVLCERFWTGKLKVQRNNYYKTFAQTRTGACDDNPSFQKTRILSEDIATAITTFRSGLKVEAQDQVETLLDIHDLDNG